MRIFVSGFGSMPDRNNPPMRSPEAIRPPVEWFDGQSALVSGHVAAPEKLGYARFVLDIDAEGAVSGCSLQDGGRLPVAAEAVCTDIEGQRFLPSLDNDGNRITGTYLVNLTPRRELVDAGASRLPILTNERDRRPMPMLAPRIDYVPSFPPSPSWMRAFHREPEWTLAPIAGLPGPDESETTMTGIVLSQSGSALACQLVEVIGHAEHDNAACSYAKFVLRPSWTDASAQQPRGVPLYISKQGDTIKAYAPDPDHNRTSSMSERSELALIVALTEAGVFPEGREESPLRIDLDPAEDGSVGHCRIVRSSGSDAGDIATCRIARGITDIAWMEDIFGRRSEYASLFWKADPTED